MSSSDEMTTEVSQEQSDSESAQLPDSNVGKNIAARIPRMSTRYFAATMDNSFLLFAFLLVGGILGETFGKIQNEAYAIALGVGMYSLSLFYFLLPEWLFSATPGKYWMGLRVNKLDGTQCDFKGALIRTLWRLVEANPFTMLPAAIMIYMTPLRRRIGDYHAGTVVVEAKKSRR